MIKALRRKFVLITMILVSAVLLAVWAGISFYYAHSLQQESYRTLEQALDKPFDNNIPHFQIGGRVPDGFRREPIFMVSVDEQGIVSLVLSEHFEVSEAELQQIVDEILALGTPRGELNAYGLRYMVRSRAGETKIAFMALSLEAGQIRNVVLVSALFVAAAFIVFLLASIGLARWALRPVEQAWQRQRRFVADASHELKTPLTVILANTGILKNHPNSNIAEQMAWVENTEQEALRMKGLVDDMLFLAKSEDMSANPILSSVNISDAIATTALSFESVAFEQGLALDLDIEPDIKLLGNEPQLKQLGAILLDNAIKYGKTGKSVCLRLRKRQTHAELRVHNEGPPIAPEEQQHLFERFYRSDPSRAEQGYGLGLSIAQAIARHHHGRITVESDTTGTAFTVFIPIK